MKTVVILCSCSGIISEKIDWSRVKKLLAGHPSQPVFKMDELACSIDSRQHLATWLEEERPDRVVVAACSPRDHESTFRSLLADVGINPYFLQMVNLREQVAWVTQDPVMATRKAARLLHAALNRVQHHQPLSERSVPVQTGVAIIGAGPAGMQAALTLAKAGRQVTLIEKEPFIGGLAVRFEELFPNLDCGPCLLEPIIGELLHGGVSSRVSLLTMSGLSAITGSFGNWNLTLRQRPRYINPDLCIGCMECAAACPVRRPHPWNGSGTLAAVDVPFAGALPNLPQIDSQTCLRLQGEACEACLNACPVEGALDFNDSGREITIQAGAVIVATGSMEQQDIPGKFSGLDELHTGYNFERLLAMNGPTGGELLTKAGKPPGSLAIVHCAGSLDLSEVPYCSGSCCRAAIKYAHLASLKTAGISVTRLVREQVVAGIEAGRQFHRDMSSVVRYTGMSNFSVAGSGADRVIVCNDSGVRVPAEMIVLMRPVVPGAAATALFSLLELDTDQAGFACQLHTLSGSCETAVKGIYLAGSCRGPDDIRAAFVTGTAAAGMALSELVEGRDLIVDPQVAVVDATVCAGCKTCLQLCPYKAISWNDRDRVADVSDMLCRGCGTCVAACPSGAISGHGFTREMLRAELEGVLS
jgi:heterodisulfide reductase subunit A